MKEPTVRTSGKNRCRHCGRRDYPHSHTVKQVLPRGTRDIERADGKKVLLPLTRSIRRSGQKIVRRGRGAVELAKRCPACSTPCARDAKRCHACTARLPSIASFKGAMS